MTVGVTFNGFLGDCSKMKKKLDAKEITRAEYENWKQTYDPGYWVNAPDVTSLWTGK